MNEREFAELAAGHALNALSEADERRYIRALAEQPEWRDRVIDDEATAAALAEGLDPVEPPPSIRAALMAQIALTPQAPLAQDHSAGTSHDAGTSDDAGISDSTGTSGGAAGHRTGSAWSRRFFVLAASLVLLVGGGIATSVVVSQLQRPASVVALDEIRSAPDAEAASIRLESGASATAHWSGSLGSAVLVASGLDELDDSKTYELWFVRGDQPIPAGVFDPDDGTATALLDGPMHAGDVIAVTIEQAGGSPTGTPTTDPILAIPTA